MEKQEDLISPILNSKLPLGQKLKEVSLLIQLHSDLGNRDRATYWAFKLSSFSSLTTQDQILKNELIASNSMILANTFWKVDFAEKAISLLNENPRLFTPNFSALFLHTGALIALGTGKFRLALDWVDKTIRIPKKERPSVSWQPYLVRAFILYSIGEEIGPAFRAAMRYARKSQLQYPLLALKVLQEISKSAFPVTQGQIDQWNAEIDRLSLLPEERNVFAFLDLKLWMRSQSQGKSMSEIMASGNKNEPFNGLTSSMGD